MPLIFSGHEHFYERVEVAGLTQIISGGGSTVLYPIDDPLPESQVLVREMHFVLLELYSDRIELSAINREGRLLDQFTIPLTGSASTAQ